MVNDLHKVTDLINNGEGTGTQLLILIPSSVFFQLYNTTKLSARYGKMQLKSSCS